MAAIERKVEVHQLTISGLPEGTGYGPFLSGLRRRVADAGDAVQKAGDKSHVLYEASVHNRRLRLRFMSFKKGHRPDVLDTAEFTVQPNPLRPNQTGVEWTHVLGFREDGRYQLLIERNTAGIWPKRIEAYLQWLIDEFHVPADEGEDRDVAPITVSLEAVPGEEFIRRVNALDRIMAATMRIVRPNPGWRDLDTDLGDVAHDSDAHKAEVHMTSRRGASLHRQNGILEWIRSKYNERRLDYAAVTGQRGRRKETFNTSRLGKHFFAEFEVDDFGQVLPDDAWQTLTEPHQEPEE